MPSFFLFLSFSFFSFSFPAFLPLSSPFSLSSCYSPAWRPWVSGTFRTIPLTPHLPSLPFSLPFEQDRSLSGYQNQDQPRGENNRYRFPERQKQHRTHHSQHERLAIRCTRLENNQRALRQLHHRPLVLYLVTGSTWPPLQRR